MEKIFIAVAWPYANGDLHVGHLAGAYLPSDIFARYHRLAGNQVLMVSGSDSHGTPITVKAEKEGVAPRAVFERYHQRFLETQAKIGISYDLFTHTDTENHYRVSQDLFLVLLRNGYLYKQCEQQMYSELQRRFLPDRYVEGVCPYCGYPSARGDQCDNCGKLLNATELINPRSRLDDTAPILKETEHYYLDLAALAGPLEEFLSTGKDHWRPGVLEFSRNYLKGGVHGRAITRDMDWGIPVPLSGWTGKSLYVWFEAVIGYLSATIEWAANQGSPEIWKEWWDDSTVRSYYFIGKDNIPFHTIIWPAQLIGAEGLYNVRKLTLPFDVPANEFMNIQGAPFSKSRQRAIWLPDLLAQYHPDTIRFYISRIMPETRDTDFSWIDFIRANNGELVATWGNLVHRVLTFVHDNLDGQVPSPGELTPEDQLLLGLVKDSFSEIGSSIAACRFREGLAKALELAQDVNRYLNRESPWLRLVENPPEAARSIYVSLQAIDALKVLLAPYLPFSAEQLHCYLGYTEPLFGTFEVRTYGESQRQHQALVYDHRGATGQWKSGILKAGTRLPPPKPLFVKLDEVDASLGSA